MNLEEIPKDFTGVKKEKSEDGVTTTYYFGNGKLYRKNNMPSITTSDNTRTEYWTWIDRKTHGLHREKGPAILLKDKEGNAIREEYWEEGERHSLDGPAVSGKDIEPEYWIEGEKLDEATWKNRSAAAIFLF